MDARKICVLAVALIASVAPAVAQVNPREPDPAVWLRQIYDSYHRAEAPEALDKLASATEVVGARASKLLAALFKRDADCETRSNEICALDWDFVVDGQDWRLSNVKVGALSVAGDKATVTVTFRNFRPCVNVYDFVREDGQWKVDDIETRCKGEAPVRIAKLLRDYDYSK